MRLADVAVATITWARSEDEERNLCASVERLAFHRLPIAVGDRGNSAAMAARLAAIAGVSVAPASSPTLVSQVQAAVHCAATFGRPFILYTEPDKADFFSSGLRGFIDSAASDPDVGVIVAGRSVAAFQTFPPVQRYTEGVMNHLCGELMGRKGDYCYGPLLFNAAFLPWIAGFEPTLGWGWRPALIARAHRLGWRVLEVTGDFPCPHDQTGETDQDRKYRTRQLGENVLGLLAD